MGLFINKLKLKAAIGSMHQFCPVVRTIFPDAPTDEVVEAATVFLYERLVRAIFGNRFADHWRAGVRAKFRYSTPIDMDMRLARIGQNVETFEQQEAAPGDGSGASGGSGGSGASDHDEFTRHVRSVIRALLVEAGAPYDDPGIVKLIFPRFENTARRLRDHLQGLKHQAQFVMR
jgi:hypothetical protein